MINKILSIAVYSKSFTICQFISVSIPLILNIDFYPPPHTHTNTQWCTATQNQSINFEPTERKKSVNNIFANIGRQQAGHTTRMSVSRGINALTRNFLEKKSHQIEELSQWWCFLCSWDLLVQVLNTTKKEFKKKCYCFVMQSNVDKLTNTFEQKYLGRYFYIPTICDPNILKMKVDILSQIIQLIQ